MSWFISKRNLFTKKYSKTFFLLEAFITYWFIHKLKLKTFAPIKRKINEQLRFKNAWNFIYGFLYGNFSKKKLAKLSCKSGHTKTHVLNLMHMQDEMVPLFFLQKEAIRSGNLYVEFFNTLAVISAIYVNMTISNDIMS